MDMDYANDYNASDLNAYNLGSHEIFLGYEWFPQNFRIKSPRFFCFERVEIRGFYPVFMLFIQNIK
jgi:hypothetical protein